MERARATSEEMAAAGMPLFAALARPRGARMQTLGARAKRARHQQQQRRRTARRRPPRQRAPLELRHSCRRRRSLRPQAAAVPAQGSSAPSRLQNCTASRANCCAAASDTLSSLAPHCYACRSERSSWAPACRARAARCLVAAQVSLPRQGPMMQQLATVLFFSLPRAGCGKFGQPPSTIRCSHHRPPRLGGLCNRQQQVAAAHVQAPHPPRPEGDASDASQTPEAGRRPGQSVASWRHRRTSEVHTRLSGQCCLRAAPESFAPWLRRPTWISTPPMRVRR